jgi:enoyl-CoA hydratase
MVEIVMNGPGKNALGSEMMDFLLGKLAEAAGKPILLTGTGDAFSAGLNLKEVASLDTAGMETFLGKLEKLMTALFLYPGPTVALVNGHAIAGGGLLTLCCDYRIATRNTKTKIGLNEVALGLRFPPQVMGIVTYRVQKFEEVVLGAGLHDPEKAYRLGLIDEVHDDARTVALSTLATLASHPAAAYAAAKSTLRSRAVAVDAEEHRRFFKEALPAWTSPELKEKIRAVLSR